MKKLFVSAFLLAIVASCSQLKEKNDVRTIDVEGDYPKKDYVLQEIADVEYVKLESNDEFVTNGIVKSVGENIIVTVNGGVDGNIFLFDRNTGKALRKINKKGEGGGYYTMANEIVLDEENEELFVVDYPARKIFVYNMQGEYKRHFPFVDESYYKFTYDYSRENLMTYKHYPPFDESEKSAHALISKADGSIVQEIGIPVGDIATPVFMGMHEKYGEITMGPSYYLTVPTVGGWLLSRPSCDTLYRYSEDGRVPCLVRTPSIHSMKSQVFLYPTIKLGNCIFMYTQKKEVDMNTLKGFPTEELVYDEAAGEVYRPSVYNDDIIERGDISFVTEPLNEKIVACLPYNAADLLVLLHEGKLRGDLKRMAETLEEEDNPVLLLVKNKNESYK